MFVVLDTPLGERLAAKMKQAGAVSFTSVITLQEVCQGWCAVINRHRAGHDQCFGYGEFQHSMELLHELVILPFDLEAASIFRRLKADGLRVGTMDLKIAAICIAHEVLLLSRNLVDFRKIPNLSVENWLD
jgi:tRNA(fMet)-specific endonuclease VapC